MRSARLVAACFGLLALLCIGMAVGCQQQEASNNAPVNDTAKALDTPTEPAPQPAKTDDRFEAWMTERPFNQAMRLMWVDAGIIIGNSYYPDIADIDSLRYSADSLAQKADRFATHFEALRDHNRDSALAAKRGDWGDTVAQNELAHQACGNCHYEFWPLSARGFMKETLEGWQETQDVFGDEPWGAQVFTGPPSVRLTMVRMREAMMRAGVASQKQDLDNFLEATEALHKFADSQFKIWDGIARQAKIIAQLAREEKLDEVGTHYTQMTQYCRDCHANLSDGRGLNPLPWR